MRLNSVRNVSFGERNEYGFICNRVTEKRSLIDGRRLSRDEVLDDVFEYCKQHKEKEEKRALNFTERDFLRVSLADDQVESLMKLINE